MANRASEASRTFTDTEEFIEDHYPVDIAGTVSIDCEVTQNGIRPT
ncbi:nucleotide-binding domain-containing protein [Brevibacterium sediminis]